MKFRRMNIATNGQALSNRSQPILIGPFNTGSWAFCYQMNWSTWGNELMQYFINTSIATTVSSLGECGVELLTLSNKESNFKTSCAVPMVVGGTTSKLTYVQIEAATVWLNTCVAYLTLIFAKFLGCRCVSVSLGADLIVRDLSLV